MRIFQYLATALIGVLTVALAAPVAALAVPSGPPAARSVAVAVPTGWHVVETPRATHTLEVTVALVAPRGTTPRFGVVEARRSIEAAGAFLSSETDGAVTVEVERVIDWIYREDDTPCSWSGAHHDLVIERTGWQGGPGRHLVVMVPAGDPCPGWANGEQGWGIAAGGRTFQPGTDVDTLVHELGHNMSLPHNFSISCAEAWDFSTVGPGVPAGCRREEYGNVLDVMGGSWWALHPLSSPNLARLGQLPQRWEPTCGGVRRLTMRPTGAGAADRTAVSFVDPRDPGARYWVDFRSQADGRKYDHLLSSPWSFRPARAGLQVQRTDPELDWATAVLERPGDRDGHRQLTDVGERVPLAGGAWVQLDAVAADGRSGDISISVPCTGSEPQPDPEPEPEPQPAAQLPAAWVLSPGTRSGRPYAATTVGVSAPTIAGDGTAAGVTAHYQWMLDGAPITGATQRTWVPPVTAVGHDLTLRLSLTAPGYLPREGTFGFGRVAQRAVPAGWVAAPPVVSGTPRVGRTVSVTGPSLTATARGAGATVYHQWFLDGRRIPGATSRTYRVPAAARGGNLTLGIAVTKTAWTPLHQTVAVGRVR